MFFAQGRAPLAALFALSSFAAAAAPVGPPVPLTFVGDADVLDAAMDASGRVVVAVNRCVGYSTCKVELQRLDANGAPVGAPIVNATGTSGLNGGDVDVAVDAAGDFAVTRKNDLNVTCYRANGTLVGSQAIPALRKKGVDIQDVAMDADGDFVVGWREVTGTATYLAGVTSETLKIRRFNVATCAATSGESVVARSSSGSAGSILPELYGDLQLAMSPNGRLAATWVFHGLFGDRVRTQSWRANGTAVGGTQAVTSKPIYGVPAVGIADDGVFVIAYPPSVTQNGSTYAGPIVYRRFSPTGTPSAPQSAGGAAPFLGGSDASVATDANGDFVLGWTSGNLTADDVRYDATLRRFAGATPTPGAPFHVAPADGTNDLFTVLHQGTGPYAALYSVTAPGADRWYLQRYIP